MRGISLRTLEVKFDTESDARGIVDIPHVPTARDNSCMSIRIGADGGPDVAVSPAPLSTRSDRYSCTR